LRGWLRCVEDLNKPVEKVVHVCEPEAGINLSGVEDEQRSHDDLKDCQEGKIENLGGQGRVDETD
jgi:hypothetical protein